MMTLMQDLRYAFRMFLKNPGFTAIAVLGLSLGIGANSAIFSVVNAVLLRPLPYNDPSRIMTLAEINPQKGANLIPASVPNFIDWKEQNQVFENVAAYRMGPSANFVLTGNNQPERVIGAAVTGNLFSVLAANPMSGRVFMPEESNAQNNRVVIISHGLWQRRFGSDPNVVGTQLSLSGTSYSVVGVMPPEFVFPVMNESAELWVPLVFGSDELTARGSHTLEVVARLKPGVSREQAQTEMTTIASRLQQQYAESNAGMTVAVVPMLERVVGNVRPALFILLGAVGFVLLIACANVANLLLVRATGRRKEFAVRTAIGATRFRLIRQLLTESTLLALMGGVVGLVLGQWGVSLLMAAAPDNIPRLKDVGLDASMVGFTFLISLVTGIIFGLAPALQSSKEDLSVSLKEGGKASASVSRNRLRSLLVVAEVAMALLLLVGAGLMIRSFLRLQQVDPGFDPKNVLTMRVNLSVSKYNQEDQFREFFQQLLTNVKTLPGVLHAEATTSVPLSGARSVVVFEIVGRPPAAAGDFLSADTRAVTSGYFNAMGIPLVKGRFFNDRDTKGTPGVVIINETLARRYFPNEDPLGKQVMIGTAPSEIVGVVKEVKQISLEAESKREIFEPFLQSPTQAMTLVVKTSSAPKNLVPAVRNQVLSLDKDQPIFNIKTMEDILSASVATPRLYMLLLSTFGILALILAAAGIYGVLAYSVTQRTHEIGIRIALGAKPSDVLRLVVGQGMLLVGIGLAIGLVAALLITRLLTSILFGVSALDITTIVVVSLVLAVVGVLACVIPARRATRISPIIALRYD